MLALTLTEPWASLVACGAKQIETRSWGTYYRGPIAIHAAKGMTRDDLDFAIYSTACVEALPYIQEYRRRLSVPTLTPRHTFSVKNAFPDTRGCVIAVARLTQCLPTRDAIRTRRLWSPYRGEVKLSDTEFALGNYEYGRYAWVLADIRKLDTPIPATGALGRWEWDAPADLAARLEAA